MIFDVQGYNGNRKISQRVEADSKEDILSYPEDFGFTKVSRVKELRDRSRRKEVRESKRTYV